MNRIDRLFATLLLLQQNKRVRAVDLAERFDISDRTVYRDMNALIEMGVPVVSLPGEGYELLASFHLPPVMLTQDEATALFIAARMMMHVGEGRIALFAETALKKITAALSPDLQAEVAKMARLIEFYPAQNRLNLDTPHLLTLLEAIEAQTAVKITYRGYQESGITERVVEPHFLMVGDGAWYLNGYCHLRHDMRTFRLNRITSLEVTQDKFQRRIMIPQRPQTITVKVRFEETLIPHVHEKQHYAFSHEETPDVLVYHVHTLDEIQNWILGFGASAEVLEPNDLRQWVRGEAERLITLITD
ncbi:MAG: YafY family protein [Chloroflexota bacterium]